MSYFIIMGAVLLVALMAFALSDDHFSRGMVLFLGTIALVVTTVISSATQINFSEVGAVSIFGELQETMLEPGFHFVTPWAKVTKMPNRYLTYQTTEHVDTSKAEYADYPVSTNTSDGQVISVEFNLNFKVTDPALVLQSFGSFDNMVSQALTPKARSYTRNSARAFTAEELQQKETVLLYTSITFEELKNELSRFGVEVDSLEIRDIEFDPDYLAAIEAQQIAEEAIETQRYRAEEAVFEAEQKIAIEIGEAEQAVIRAEADAEVKLINADADAEVLLITARAEAESITLQGESLKKNPSMIAWEFVKTWSEHIDWGILPDSVMPLMQISP